MPRVVITKLLYAHTNEDALRLAREARMNGSRSEIISDDEYVVRNRTLGDMQDLTIWASKNGVEFKPSI